MVPDDDEFDALPSKKKRAIKTRIEYAVAGVKNKKQLKQKEDQARLRLLHVSYLSRLIIPLSIMF